MLKCTIQIADMHQEFFFSCMKKEIIETIISPLSLGILIVFFILFFVQIYNRISQNIGYNYVRIQKLEENKSIGNANTSVSS